MLKSKSCATPQFAVRNKMKAVERLEGARMYARQHHCNLFLVRSFLGTPARALVEVCRARVPADGPLPHWVCACARWAAHTHRDTRRLLPSGRWSAHTHSQPEPEPVKCPTPSPSLLGILVPWASCAREASPSGSSGRLSRASSRTRVHPFARVCLSLPTTANGSLRAICALDRCTSPL
jgi:hypothetical protein